MAMQQFQFIPNSRMSAPVKFASIAFGIVLFLPILMLVIIAGAVAAVVFALLLIVGLVRRTVRTLFVGKDDDGRKNVRIKRD